MCKNSPENAKTIPFPLKDVKENLGFQRPLADGRVVI
jgi:hypothetical protein